MCKINGKKLKEIRENKGISTKELAEKVGLSRSAINHYESNIDNPKDETVDKICLFLKINKNDIEVADVGYNFTSGEGKLTEKIRKKKGFVRYSTPRQTEEFIQAHSNAGENIEIKEVDCALKNSFSIASKRYILINPAFVHVPDWQRDTDMAKVQEIAQYFNEDKYDPAKVYIKERKLYVADGAHRIVAFVINGEIKIRPELNSNGFVDIEKTHKKIYETDFIEISKRDYEGLDWREATKKTNELMKPGSFVIFKTDIDV